ncbi:TonB-dependent receptor [Neptunicella sp. SCSIO 80796]|uniref:TonB-dependent receptor n=1 Tax=Neptunicella plasticusilytica TaxID=3117012 RepID=UPI003A4DD8A8
MKYTYQVVLAILIAIYSSHLVADDFNWHGFVAQGAIQAKNSNFINQNGETSFELTEAGINGSYQFNNKLRLSGQAVYLNGGNRYSDGVRLDYLFLDWSIVSSLDWQLNAHIGRFKNYHWLYSATRDVPHTRPSIILPQSIYFDVFRDIALGTDGIALRASINSDIGEWDIDWGYGNTPIGKSQTQNLFSQQANGDMDLKFDHKLSAYFRPKETNLQMGISLLDSEFEYVQGQQDMLQDGKASVQRVIFNLKYGAKNWDLVAEIMQERVEYEDIVYPGFHNDTKSQGGYLQTTYHLNENWDTYVRLDLFDLDKNDRNGQQRWRQSNGAIPNYFGYMDTATFGGAWNIDQQWKLALEFHRVKGRGRLAPVLVPDLLNNKGEYWNMWAAQLMYWF